jgi:hypothetical protein
MDIAYLSPAAALAGAVVGGLTTGLTTWIGQRAQARAARLEFESTRRQDLFKEFIVTAAKAYGDALVSLIKSGVGIDPLKEFSKAARRGLIASDRL